MTSRASRFLLPALIAAVGLIAGACDRSATPANDSAATPPGYVVDSSLPIDTLLARFRATIPDTATALVGGEPSAERLAREFLRAVSGNDSASIRRLVLSRSEFAWLYYPHTRFTKPPYELAPDLLWLQVNEASEKGVVRALRRFSGSALRFEALICPDSVTVEGPNRITLGCQVKFATADSAARTMRIFGSLLERDGRWKIISYTNDL